LRSVCELCGSLDAAPVGHKQKQGFCGGYDRVDFDVLVGSMSIPAARSPQHSRYLERLLEYIQIARAFNPRNYRFFADYFCCACG
jgi:hypothetical protein